MMANITSALERVIWCAYLLLLIVVGVITSWALDRSPPFALGEYAVTSPHPGGSMVLRARVWRDLQRRCSVTYSRYMYDGDGIRTDLQPQTTMNHEGILRMQERSPWEWRLSVPIPESAHPGPAQLVTDLEYVCNPLHRLWPIQVQAIVDLEILPKEQQ